MKQFRFWDFIGKVAVLISIIWWSIQLFSFFRTGHDYEIEASYSLFPYIERNTFTKTSTEFTNFESNSQPFDLLLVADINNTGNRHIEDAVLETDVNGQYMIIRPDSTTAVLLFNKSIGLGKIRTGSKLRICFWAKSFKPFSQTPEKNIILSFSGGAIDIKPTKRVSGFYATISVLPTYMFIVLIFLLSFLILFVAAILIKILEKINQSRHPRRCYGKSTP
jgi:hypothetical protein